MTDENEKNTTTIKTRQIKLFSTANVYIDEYYDGGYNQMVLNTGISDWETVTEEEYQYIRNNLSLLNSYRKQSVIIVEKLDNAHEAISDIKAMIRKLERDEEKRKEAERKRKEEAAEKRAMKKLERDKKALAKLLEANPDLIKDFGEVNDKQATYQNQD